MRRFSFFAGSPQKIPLSDRRRPKIFQLPHLPQRACPGVFPRIFRNFEFLLRSLKNPKIPHFLPKKYSDFMALYRQ